MFVWGFCPDRWSIRPSSHRCVLVQENENARVHTRGESQPKNILKKKSQPRRLLF